MKRLIMICAIALTQIGAVWNNQALIGTNGLIGEGGRTDWLIGPGGGSPIFSIKTYIA